MGFRRGFFTLLGAAVVWAGLVAVPARATQFRWMGLDEMVQRADAVVHARVIGSRVETDPESHAHYTVTRFQVLAPGVGTLRSGDEFELRLLGGQAPDSGYRTSVPGMPVFEAGQERIVFLSTTADGQRILVGERGALRVEERADGPVVIGAPALAPTGLQPTIELVPASVRRSDRPATRVPESGSEAEEPATRAVEFGHRVAPSGPPTVEAFLDRVRRMPREGDRQ